MLLIVAAYDLKTVGPDFFFFRVKDNNLCLLYPVVWVKGHKIQFSKEQNLYKVISRLRNHLVKQDSCQYKISYYIKSAKITSHNFVTQTTILAFINMPFTLTVMFGGRDYLAQNS